MAVSKRLRYEILRRDDNTCRYCGGRAPDVTLTVDHVIPVALGGSDLPDNLVTACRDCNSGKSASSPDAPIVSNVAEDAVRWAKAIETAAAAREAAMDTQHGWISDFQAAWYSWTDHKDDYFPLQDDFDISLVRFINHGLTIERIISFVRIAMTKKGLDADQRFTYFCGVCWRELDDRRAMALESLRGPERSDEPPLEIPGYVDHFTDGFDHRLMVQAETKELIVLFVDDPATLGREASAATVAVPVKFLETCLQRVANSAPLQDDF